MRFNYKDIIGQYDGWVKKNRSDKMEADILVFPALNRFLTSSPDEGACRVAGGELSYWATCLEHDGVLLIADDNSDGWAVLSRAAVLRYWDHRILCRSYDRAQNKRKAQHFIPNTLRVGLNALYCFSLDQWNEGLWLEPVINFDGRKVMGIMAVHSYTFAVESLGCRIEKLTPAMSRMKNGTSARPI